MSEAHPAPLPVVLVCGGRDYNDWTKFRRVMGDLMHIYRFASVVHGGARGADTLAGRWAAMKGLVAHERKADWNKHGKAAGHIRNQEMLDIYAPNLVVAFPGGRGTADMVRRSRLAGIPVEVIG